MNTNNDSEEVRGALRDYAAVRAALADYANHPSVAQAVRNVLHKLAVARTENAVFRKQLSEARFPAYTDSAELFEVRDVLREFTAFPHYSVVDAARDLVVSYKKALQENDRHVQQLDAIDAAIPDGFCKLVGTVNWVKNVVHGYEALKKVRPAATIAQINDFCLNVEARIESFSLRVLNPVAENFVDQKRFVAASIASIGNFRITHQTASHIYYGRVIEGPTSPPGPAGNDGVYYERPL